MKNKKINTSAFKHLYPFKSHYLNIKGLNYHYLDKGNGDPVVMLHGNPTWSFYFRNMVKTLSPEYRTIVPDHIGCGLSDKPDTKQYDFKLKSRVDDLEYLLDYLKLGNNISLLVHDWGGMIGMAYALKNPERISRIIITNTAGFFPPGKKKLPVRLWIIRNILPFAVPAVLGLNLFSAAALHMAPYKKLSKDVKHGLKAPYNCPGNRIATLKFVQDIPVYPKDPGYNLVKYVDENLHLLADIPMLICWGQHDFVFDTDYYNEWKRRFPNAETHFFKDGGHYLLEDKPGEVGVCVKDFLKKYSG
ncbi:Alpha/beta hydrolase fold-containing protein [Desulfonema limicola]|uniref:Alpha/beta hydrolase fold-containing protein n=1 Tax=Desulfonema limicola TaxID=45656 RepID=A0A975B664_9BACT|nr:alpha/beta fold hydrolase [Desulfonema limicola]QTA79534.1 Alpha/beta hydrolase fold-containing protein [Desulfonema limicola]